MLRKLGIVVVGLVALFFIVAALLPSTYSVERSIEIAHPAREVFREVANFRSWLEWSPWGTLEPEAQHEFEKAMGTRGHSWSWKGDEIGEGTLTIVDFEFPSSLQSSLTFTAPMESTAHDYWTFEETPTGTHVTWRNEGELPYLYRYFGLMMDSVLGSQFEEGLSQLKLTLESREAPATEDEVR
jgi:hypothetical protein